MMYKITLKGCDDWTDIYLDLSDDDLDLLEKVADESKRISYNDCMPVMKIKKSSVKEAEDARRKLSSNIR